MFSETCLVQAYVSAKAAASSLIAGRVFEQGGKYEQGSGSILAS